MKARAVRHHPLTLLGWLLLLVAGALLLGGCERTRTIVGPTRVDTLTVQKPGVTDTLYRQRVDTVVTATHDTTFVPRTDTLVVFKHDTTIVVKRDTVTILHTDTLYLSKLPNVVCLFITTGDTLAALSWRDSPYCGADWQSKFVDSSKIRVVLNVDRVCMRIGPGPWPPCEVPLSPSPLILPGYLRSHP